MWRVSPSRPDSICRRCTSDNTSANATDPSHASPFFVHNPRGIAIPSPRSRLRNPFFSRVRWFTSD